ncbi:MAG: hypothetical protein J5574_07025, partial [Lachnospiraceae bacterium]|nr:hypothetical protein [Lachnospiraceae bacterium]
DEEKAIPYIDTDTAKELMERAFREINEDEGFELTVTKEGHTATFTRENRYPMMIDADRDVIDFADYDAFFMPSWSDNIVGVLEHYGTINCLQCNKELSYSRYGAEVVFELGKYGIDIFESDGECYIPMQTLSDIALSINTYVNLIYNGEAVYARELTMGDDSQFLSGLYKAGTGSRSRALADFTYNEFCMTLDYFYGLKDRHGIDGFDDFFYETGLKYGVLSEDVKESDQAYADLMVLYLDDLHSGYVKSSYLAGEDHRPDFQIGNSIRSFSETAKRFKAAREESHPDGMPGYEEVGNTAYITFDTFDTIEKDRDYYSDPPTSDTKDTVGLCLYAFSQIKRKDSPIENVVLDLSNNTGGDSTTASFVLSMFLGKASICVKDVMTGAYSNESFSADADLDGDFDENDSLTDRNLYCITSPVSFSCGNLVPSVLKNSHVVTMIGQTSGGGSCMVMPVALADGTLLQISGNKIISYMKNGSVYDVDQGVEPDLYMGKPESFYDRVSLTEFINESR